MEWEGAHPEYGPQLSAFLDKFLADPADPTLIRTPFLGSDGKPKPNTWHYDVPGVPIPLIIEVENADRVRNEIEGMIDEPDDAETDDGERWAKVLYPRGPDDVIPDRDMI